MERLAQLLGLSEDQTEQFLSRLVVAESVQAKIDRLDRVVIFTPALQPVEVLNEWSAKVSRLMALLKRTNHLICKEQMLHNL